MKNVAVIGGGITGLSAAFELQRQNINCTLYEASDRVGGVIRTIQKDGFLIECGPNSILDTHPDLGRFLQQVGIEKQLPNSAAQNRFIVRNAKPVALPHSPPSFFTSNAFSARAKLRLLSEPFIRSRSTPSESLADFVVRRLGQEFLDYAINPFVGGIYAGDPAKLSTKYAFPKLYDLEQKYRSLIKGAILGARARKKRAEVASKDARMFTFKKGLEQLPQTLAKHLEARIKRNHPVLEVKSLPNQKWEIDGQIYSHLILAIPAYKLDQIKTDLPLAPLAKMPYAPVTSLSLGFKKEQFKHPLNGFGILFPQIEKRYALGALFPSSIFSERAKEAETLLTLFIGGAMAPEKAAQSDDELLQHARIDLQEILGCSGEPITCSIHRSPQAIPQYNLGHESFVQQINQIEKQYLSVRFAGPCCDGISVGNAILSGLRTARKIIL